LYNKIKYQKKKKKKKKRGHPNKTQKKKIDRYSGHHRFLIPKTKNVKTRPKNKNKKR
jgi:hypothetical protein